MPRALFLWKLGKIENIDIINEIWYYRVFWDLPTEQYLPEKQFTSKLTTAINMLQILPSGDTYQRYYWTECKL